jgi:hypothetical protein
LQPGESHTIEIEFQPNTSGLFECVLDLGDNVCGPLHLRAHATRTWGVQKGLGGDTEGIQEAIDSAVSGDTIHVSPGRYVENIDYLGKDILLKSLEGPEKTIIDGSGLDTSVVRMVSEEARAAVLEGFTVTGGAFSGFQAAGGGILLINSEATIRGNIITGNQAIEPVRDNKNETTGLRI